MKYVVSWQVFGVHEVEADDEESAMQATEDWLRDNYDMTAATWDGIDLRADKA